MAKGNEILINGVEPKGRVLEGTISGTPKPGTCMQIKAATEPVSGRFTWEIFNRAGDAIPYLVCVLLPDQLQGKTATDAYVTATRGFMYIPHAGDELNMLVADVSGTAATSDYAIGDELQIQDDTGLLEDATVGTAFARSRPFIVLETITDMAADALVHCMFTGY